MSQHRSLDSEAVPPSLPSLEIERKYLLNAMPAIPTGAEVWQIEQGYLNRTEGDPDQMRGRLRRTVMPDGSIVHTHTIKHGSGICKREVERTISQDEFDMLWPRTMTRRLRKTRHRVRAGGDDLIWEIDQFSGIDLILAEVELPTAELQPTIPAWLAPHIVRDVTHDPAYTNASIARRISFDQADTAAEAMES